MAVADASVIIAGAEMKEAGVAPVAARRSDHAAQRISRVSRVHEGEAEWIALAHSRRDMLIVDDKEAHAVAEAMQLEYLGTAAVLLNGFLEGHLGMRELEDAVEEMARTIWLSPAMVTEVGRRAAGGVDVRKERLFVDLSTAI